MFPFENVSLGELKSFDQSALGATNFSFGFRNKSREPRKSENLPFRTVNRGGIVFKRLANNFKPTRFVLDETRVRKRVTVRTARVE